VLRSEVYIHSYSAPYIITPLRPGFCFFSTRDVIFSNCLINGAEPTEENIEKRLYGNAAVTYMKKESGEVFAAGTCGWVHGLKGGDPFVERVTKNVMDRFTS
jgi:hypothetical protein